MHRIKAFIGVDVQTARGCAFATIDEGGNRLNSGWLPIGNEQALVRLRELVNATCQGTVEAVAVGIDAPRAPLSSPRRSYWDGTRQSWRPCRDSDRGAGRHCEVVVAASRLANPQWTPALGVVPNWMALGFGLFAGLADYPHVFEVFPSASYRQLAADESVHFQLSLKDFAAGPKDMLDAYVAAVTVREFAQGRGQAVGGGDGCGQIILPRPLQPGSEKVLEWPAV